jgi:beta-1,2-mannobiose phosphorylase / 1,2-beta-oligomannan phosphorylase
MLIANNRIRYAFGTFGGRVGVIAIEGINGNRRIWRSVPVAMLGDPYRRMTAFGHEIVIASSSRGIVIAAIDEVLKSNDRGIHRHLRCCRIALLPTRQVGHIGKTAIRPLREPLDTPTGEQPESRIQLQRTDANPILAPSTANPWETEAVFNAGAIHAGGRVHLVYRAIGHDGASVLGYASSADGIHIEERSAEPIYRDGETLSIYGGEDASSPSAYGSGPSLYGCEDPRLTLIDDRVFMTYTVFDGCHAPSVAMTSIHKDDFLAQRWHWRPPVLISEPHDAHKNWVIFPRRINGKYAILHGLWPQLRIEYRDTLDFGTGDFIRSRYACGGDPSSWDNRLRGAGPPPIWTPDGWLLLYHAMDQRDPGRYKLGIMLLQSDRPERIIARLPYPLLEPDAACENEGFKRGVVYACGAVVIDNVLHVYYGGSDTVLCAATIALPALLAQLRRATSAQPSMPNADSSDRGSYATTPA